MTLHKILEFAKEQGYEDVEFSCKWRGYDVYTLIYRKDEPHSCTGLPFVALVQGDTIRISTTEETFQYMDEVLGTDE